MAQIQYKKKQGVSSKRIIWGLILATFMVFSAIFWFFYPFASNEKKAYFQGVNPILYNGAQRGNALVEGSTVFLPYSFLKKDFDDSIMYDKQTKSVIFTTKDKVVQMPEDAPTYYVNEKPVKQLQTSIISKNGEIYISLHSLLSFYPIQYKVLPDSQAIWIQKDGEEYKQGIISTKNTNKDWLRLRISPSVRTPYTADTRNNEPIMIEGEKDGFYLVRKEDGTGGYIKKDFVKIDRKVNIQISENTKPFQLPKLNGPVKLTWEAVYTKTPDASKIPAMPGLNVVSPTWFSLAGEDGSVKNLASLTYSKWAHQKGCQVWGLFSNSFNPDLTYETLKNFKTRQNIIRQLLRYSKQYQLQGINFDIENVNEEDGPLVTQLVREAAPYFHRAGKYVSMDITFPSGDHNNWSSFYERTKLSQIADYIIVMAYDEHTSAATGEGSVASLPWVESNLKNLLTEVPEQKLVLGVPLYSRLWKEQTSSDGSKKVTSQALSMDMVNAWLASKGVQPSFDKKSGQNYAEYVDKTENATYKIWIEDEISLKARAELAVKYNLAGVASWSRNFGDQTAWTALNYTDEKNLTKK